MLVHDRAVRNRAARNRAARNRVADTAGDSGVGDSWVGNSWVGNSWAGNSWAGNSWAGDAAGDNRVAGMAVARLPERTPAAIPALRTVAVVTGRADSARLAWWLAWWLARWLVRRVVRRVLRRPASPRANAVRAAPSALARKRGSSPRSLSQAPPSPASCARVARPQCYCRVTQVATRAPAHLARTVAAHSPNARRITRGSDG